MLTCGICKTLCTSTVSLGKFGMLKIARFVPSHFVFGILGTTPLLLLNLFLEACFLDFYEHLLLL